MKKLYVHSFMVLCFFFALLYLANKLIATGGSAELTGMVITALITVASLAAKAMFDRDENHHKDE